MEQNILGTMISSLRKEKGMTQDALAKQLGVTFQAVSKWENGLSCPDIVMLPELADLFGVSIDALFGRAPLAPEDLPAETTAPAQSQVVYGDLPWEDDRSVLHAVLFAGHQLVGDSLFQRHQKEKQRLEFCYEGPAINIQSDFSVTCAEGTEIRGSVKAGNGVTCGPVLGNVQAGNSVRCGDVGGSVRASFRSSSVISLSRSAPLSFVFVGIDHCSSSVRSERSRPNLMVVPPRSTPNTYFSIAVPCPAAAYSKSTLLPVRPD